MAYHDEPAFDREQEREPLLSHENEPIVVPPHQSLIHETHSPRAIIAIIIFVIFIISFAGTLMSLPSLRIMENIICHRHYDKIAGEGHLGLQENIDEGRCKGDEIQNEMNIILGVSQFLEAIPGMLVAIPYGLLADRIGRKPVFALVAIGYVLNGLWDAVVMWFWKTLPLRLLWISPMFYLIGGGNPTAGTIFYAIGSDVTTAANRANVFLLGACSGHLANLIGPPLAAAMMTRSPWIPYLVGYVLLILGSLCVAFVPETLHLHASESSILEPGASSQRSPSPSRKAALLYAVKSHVSVGVKKLRDSASVLTIPIVLLLFTYITLPFASVAGDLFVRYVSKRFQWTLAKTGFLISFRAGVNIILLVLVLPFISHLMVDRFHYSAMAKDLSLARISVVCAAVGAFCVAASPTIGLTIAGLMIWTLGTGFSSLCRSLITSLVDKEHLARLYSVIAIVETAGALAASPLLAALFSLGLKLKGPWIGLPFFALGLIYAFAGLGVMIFGFLTRKAAGGYDSDSQSVVGESLSLHEDA